MRFFAISTLFAACTCQPEPTIPPTPSAPPEAPAPEYEVHEWGLINVSDEGAELAAGPGRQHDVIEELGVQGYGKPVLYFHLADGSPEFDIRVDVNVRSFTLAEHYPPAEVDGNQLAWRGHVAPCSPFPSRSYPTAESEICQGAVDGYCEALELEAYESGDAACVSIGESEWPLLFYRGSPAEEAPPLPLRLGFDDEGAFAVRGDGASETVGKIWYMMDERVEAVVDWPAPGEMVRLHGDAPPGPRTLMHEELVEHGLSEGEADAFGRAWYETLFGPPPTTESEDSFGTIGVQGTGRGGGGVGEGTIGLGNGGLVGRTHVVTHRIVYWLPAADHAAMAQLRFDPEPSAVRRATLVRDQRSAQR